MCDRICCSNKPKYTLPTVFGANAKLCTKCLYEWKTMAYNLHMNFMGLLEFEQRAFLGQAKPPEEMEGADTIPPPPMPITQKTEEEYGFRNEDTDPGTPTAKKGGLDTAADSIEIIYT